MTHNGYNTSQFMKGGEEVVIAIKHADRGVAVKVQEVFDTIPAELREVPDPIVKKRFRLTCRANT